MPSSGQILCELTIIGSGMAGMAAALFAANRGLSTVLVGCTGEILFASGLLDLLGVHPVEEKHIWQDPWTGIETLVRDIPNHPYARVKNVDIHASFEEILLFLKEAGLPYCRRMNINATVVTPLGTVKPTYCVPQNMWSGVEVLEKKIPCLLIDIQGLKGFSARQIKAVFQDRWPGLRSERIAFPEGDHLSEMYTERMAMYLELPQNRDKFARTIQPHIKDAQALGMPAILGIYRTAEIVFDLEKKLGVPIFEIPTMLPSVPGMRLKEAFHQRLPGKGVQIFFQKRVLEVRPQPDGCFVLYIGNHTTEHTIRSSGIVLASGRFLGGGLHADRKGVRETIFNLPVFQSGDRKDWHREDFLDPRGHPINRAGIEIDDNFRVIDTAGHPVFQRIFAAGSILAHQDWMRMHCGSGLAIATAFGAVQSYVSHFR